MSDILEVLFVDFPFFPLLALVYFAYAGGNMYMAGYGSDTHDILINALSAIDRNDLSEAQALHDIAKERIAFHKTVNDISDVLLYTLWIIPLALSVYFNRKELAANRRGF